MKIGRLHVLTDYHFQQEYTHSELARLAIEGGADLIQFRQKSGTIRHKLHGARLTARVCKAYKTPLIIDDHIDIAMALEATGVHLGRTDFPLPEARAILGAEYLIGATANSMKQALRANEHGADYIGFGPIYPSHSKNNPAPLQGLNTLEDVCKSVDVPVIAISGITVDRVIEVFDAGAFGVAVMTAISTSSDPLSATVAFREEIDRLLGPQPGPAEARETA